MSPTQTAAWLRENVKDQVMRARFANLIERVREYEQSRSPRPKKVTFTVTHKRDESIPF